MVLRKLKMSEDQKSQIRQVLNISLGENDLNFEANCDKLPTEFTLVFSNGDEKYIRATWNSECTDGIVNKILVTIIDATAEKELERFSTEQKTELRMMQELLNVSSEKASQFFSVSHNTLLENRFIVENRELGPHELNLLFVNAHTVKGSARTMGLLGVAEHMHRLEEKYSLIRSGEAQFEKELLLEDISDALKILDEYMKVNVEKLNRVQGVDRVLLDREVLHRQLANIKTILNSSPSRDMSNLLEKSMNELNDCLFEKLPQIFEEYKEITRKIAIDLDKVEPEFEFQIENLFLDSEMKTALDNSMIHILRNIVDHGVEETEDRLRKNKNPAAKIKISAMKLEKIIQITIEDDGRGLNLTRIRQKALSAEILPAEASNDEVAESIFHAGLSTSDHVTNISGRGVGMNAVRSFMESIGGTIGVLLGAPKEENSDFFHFQFNIELPILDHGELEEVS